MKRSRIEPATLASLAVLTAAALTGVASTAAAQPDLPPEVLERMKAMRNGAEEGDKKKEDFKPFEEVIEGYKKVVSTADGDGMYDLYIREKDGQMLGVLPRNFEHQNLFVALTLAGGSATAGIQSGDMYTRWKRFDKRLALIQPNLAVRTSGDMESDISRKQLFTDRVVLDVPIVAMSPSGGPVIDLDELFVGHADKFYGRSMQGVQSRLATIAKAKSFPENVEVAYQLPTASGVLTTIHYSLRALPENTGYKPREADSRVGFFTTVYRDLGKVGQDDSWVRYINRWRLEKADPKLSLSPPKDPIVWYIEDTTPIRYRRWVRDGILEWNKAFEKVGIVNAVEVYQQDSRTGAHMEKDPEDARYNFLRWNSNSIGFAIGPSRVDPRTGEILDADVVLNDGFIRGWARSWRGLLPEIATEGFTPETLAWLDSRPQWDPRIRMAPLAERDRILAERAQRRAAGADAYAGHPAANADPTLMGDDLYDGLAGRISQVNGMCTHATGRSLDIAMFRFAGDMLVELAAAGDNGGEGNGGAEDDVDDADMLDGVPDWFIGPMVKDLVMHEVGHCLGLRHNFKASSIYSIEQINSPEVKGKAHTASVMDYNPINVNYQDGPEQGDYTMVTIGPYDHWVIEYGYTFEKDTKAILGRVSDNMVPFATDEDTWGPDPLARRYDFGADPLDWAESRMRLVKDFRGRILDKMVDDGDSWAKARDAYLLLLSQQMQAVSVAANWIGGAHVFRDRKGDPGDRDPIEVVAAEKQRRALQFVMDNTFYEKAFGLTPELLQKMTVDKWWDDGGMGTIFEDPTWPVHERVLAIQSSALTMVMNPTTLQRVFDNEFRVAAEEDAITVPEVLFGISDAIWSELDAAPNRRFTDRQPMVSSLRRNLQREHIDRLIDLSLPNDAFGASAKPVANLAVYKLREISSRIGGVLERADSKIDPYTMAHLSEARVRIDKALDAQYIYNTDDIASRPATITLPFGALPAQ